MYPIIFQYKSITLGSYGLFFGLAFYLSFIATEREFRRRGINPELAYKLLIIIVPSSIIGAKLFHILENLKFFLKEPGEILFSGSGLSVYGGLIFSFLVSYLLIRRSGEKVLPVFDAAAAPLALGYGIGRIGCHMSGDGCYGIPTDSIFGMTYPDGIVPVTIPVYPTPLFESFFSFVFFLLLLKLRKYDLKPGFAIFTYLILNGTSRFFIEFIRLNPEIALGLTQAQFIATGLILLGITGHYWLYRTEGEKIDNA